MKLGEILKLDLKKSSSKIEDINIVAKNENLIKDSLNSVQRFLITHKLELINIAKLKLPKNLQFITKFSETLDLIEEKLMII